MEWVVRLKRNCMTKTDQKWDYLRVDMPGARYSHGGNQMWWAEKKENVSKTFARIGCGVIAMIDLEVFLCMQRKGYSIPISEKDQAELVSSCFWKPMGNQADITKHDYENLVDQAYLERYRIGNDPINRMVGLYPWKMEKGLRRFLKWNDCERKQVKWAPFWKRGKEQKKLVLQAVKDMLGDGFPVVCSYHTFQKKHHLVLHKSMEEAAKTDQNGFDEGGNALVGKSSCVSIGSHYMTIIGILKDDEGHEYLQFVSWGRIYYASFHAYARDLNYFTNILYIH